MNAPVQIYCMMMLMCCLLFAPADAASDQIYDPLTLSASARPEPYDVTVQDSGRKRSIPLRIYLPAQKTPAPVVLFSHGLGGSRTGNAYLGNHWSARGYVAVFLQHPGSDESVWKDRPVGERRAALKKAVSIRNFMLRTQDVHTVLDQLEIMHRTSGHILADRLDMRRVGMSGHSFGATTAQAVSGERFLFDVNQTDPRIRAAVMMSPGAPRHGDLIKAFGKVSVPWMLLTGTKDHSLIVDDDAASRLKIFPALPPGSNYELVLYNAEHSAFNQTAIAGDKEKRNPNHHRAILALTTAFWDTYLRNDPAAKEWLDGDGPRTILEPEDRWQKK